MMGVRWNYCETIIPSSYCPAVAAVHGHKCKFIRTPLLNFLIPDQEYLDTILVFRQAESILLVIILLRATRFKFDLILQNLHPQTPLDSNCFFIPLPNLQHFFDEPKALILQDDPN